MPEEPLPTNVCKDCNGSGFIDGEFHVLCLGTGQISGDALRIFLKTFYDDVTDKLTDIKEKVDEIKTVVDAL